MRSRGMLLSGSDGAVAYLGSHMLGTEFVLRYTSG